MRDNLYTSWLGIAPGLIPPDHYALLGLPRYCADSVKIEAAARRQLEKLDRYSLHPDPHRRDVCHELMNEVARARNILRDPVKRATYDSDLIKRTRVTATPPRRTGRPLGLRLSSRFAVVLAVSFVAVLVTIAACVWLARPKAAAPVAQPATRPLPTPPPLARDTVTPAVPPTPNPSNPVAPTAAAVARSPSGVAPPAPQIIPPPAPAAPPAGESSPPVPPTARVRPALQPVPPGPEDLLDQRIGTAIQRGADYLLGQFDPKTHLLPQAAGGNDPSFLGGRDALAVNALLQCGEATSEKRRDAMGPGVAAMVDALRAIPIEEGSKQTYAHGIRAAALASAVAIRDRKEDRDQLKKDASWLVMACNDGSYTYGMVPHAARGTKAHQFGFDNSNSQYGLIGVASAAEVDIEINDAYWKMVDRHWTECQNDDGRWSYGSRGPGGRLTMTCAGIASEFVVHDYLDEPRFLDLPGRSFVVPPVGQDPYAPAVKKALAWIEQGDRSVDLMGGMWGYTLYGLERVGLASGFKNLGSHDWYRELAERIVDHQAANGSWGDEIETSYALLFLSRGRHPVLMNKLRFDGSWANRPRDVAHLARFAGKKLERPLNWQVVDVREPWTTWTDSPLLYLASHEDPKLTDADLDGLHSFIEAGGMLFVHADADSRAFDGFAEQLAVRLFPAYPMTDVPPDHPILTRSTFADVEPRPPLRMVSNGSRVLMLYSPKDIAKHWQARDDRVPGSKGLKVSPSFQLGVNLFVYAAGKQAPRNRLDSWYVAPAPTSPMAPTMTMTVARVEYAGNWDPEPGAWRSFQNRYHRQTGYGLDLKPTKCADLGGLDPADTPVAHVTGTGRYAFSEAEIAGVQKYVEAGGVLLVDTCGGAGQFDQGVRTTLLAKAFPAALARTVPPGHPLLNAGTPGMVDVSKPRLRPYAAERLGEAAGVITVASAGKGHVLFTSLDVTSGLLGTDTGGILGYEPHYCQGLVSNIILWALDGQKDEQPPSHTGG